MVEKFFGDAIVFGLAVTNKVEGDEVHIIRVLYGRRNFMQILFGKSYDE